MNSRSGGKPEVWRSCSNFSASSPSKLISYAAAIVLAGLLSFHFLGVYAKMLLSGDSSLWLINRSAFKFLLRVIFARSFHQLIGWCAIIIDYWLAEWSVQRPIDDISQPHKSINNFSLCRMSKVRLTTDTSDMECERVRT